MAVYVGLAIGLMIGGLVICMLSGNAKQPTLQTLFWWVGIIVAVCGLVMALEPILAWIARNLREMLAA